MRPILILGISGAILGPIATFYPNMALILACIGAIIAICALFLSERRNTNQEKENARIVNHLSATNGFNPYSEQIQEIIINNGRLIPFDLTKKAYDLNNNDPIAIKHMAIYLSVSLGNIRKYSNPDVFNLSVKTAKMVGKKIKYIDQDMYLFLSGVIYDEEKNHNMARKMFLQMGKSKMQDMLPYYLIALSVSHAKEADYATAIDYIKEFIRISKFTFWYPYMLYGGYLIEVGEYKEALIQLNISFKNRGCHMDIIHGYSRAYHLRGDLIKSGLLVFIYGYQVSAYSFKKSLPLFAIAVTRLVLGLGCFLSKMAIPLSRRVKIISKIHKWLLDPSKPELQLAMILLERQNYVTGKEMMLKALKNSIEGGLVCNLTIIKKQGGENKDITFLLPDEESVDLFVTDLKEKRIGKLMIR